MANVNIRNVNLAFQKQFWETASGRNLARGQAQVRINAARNAMILAYQNHPVTLELRGGPSSSISYTGREGQPNLFSFLGFRADSDPLNILDQIVNVPRPAQLSSQQGLVYSFSVPTPTESDIHEAVGRSFDSNLEWTSSAWTELVDAGLPDNIAHYVVFSDGVKGSRSGNALQIENVRLSNSFNPTPYISRLVEVFNTVLVSRFSGTSENVSSFIR